MRLPDLYQYADYRIYLRDMYALNKVGDPSFSYRYLAVRAGINSSAFFKYVIEGKRNLGPGTLLKTCAALGLRDRDAEYFENLVFFNQGKTVAEKNDYFTRLTRLRGRLRARKIEESQYAFYGEWHHTVIRELLHCLPFRGDYADLAARLQPPITPRQAEASLSLLHRLDLARKDAQGRWHPSDAVITSGDQMAIQAVIRFQMSMLDLAKQAFDHTAPEERIMSSTTFSFSKATLDLLKKRVLALKAEFLERARLDQDCDRVYHLNLNLFPVTRSAKE